MLEDSQVVRGIARDGCPNMSIHRSMTPSCRRAQRRGGGDDGDGNDLLTGFDSLSIAILSCVPILNCEFVAFGSNMALAL